MFQYILLLIASASDGKTSFVTEKRVVWRRPKNNLCELWLTVLLRKLAKFLIYIYFAAILLHFLTVCYGNFGQTRCEHLIRSSYQGQFPFSFWNTFPTFPFMCTLYVFKEELIYFLHLHCLHSIHVGQLIIHVDIRWHVFNIIRLSQEKTLFQFSTKSKFGTSVKQCIVRLVARKLGYFPQCCFHCKVSFVYCFMHNLQDYKL